MIFYVSSSPPPPREVGGRKLMVGTRLARDLDEFSGDLSLEGLRFWKTAFSAMTHPTTNISLSSQARGVDVSEGCKEQVESYSSSASDKKVILLPCKNAPSRDCVQLWLQARKQYENLQKLGKDTELLKKGGGELDVEEGNPERSEQPPAPCCPAVKVELCGKSLNSTWTQRRTKRNLSLIISPMKNTGSQCNSTEASPISDEVVVDLDQEEEEKAYDNKTTSPESPELPTWQQSCQPSPSDPHGLNENRLIENSPGTQSPRLSDSQRERQGENHSPSPLRVSNREEGRTSPHLLHSTPLLRRQRRSKDDLEPVCSTPICDGKKTAVSSLL